MTDETQTEEAQSDAIMMDRFVTLTYHDHLPPATVRFADALVAGRIVGQKCPACGRVYCPPKGYCPLDVVIMGPEHDVDVSDHGTVTGFTIVAPVRYYGQTKTEPFVYASVLLDGASSPLGGQDVSGIPADHVHAGLRVRAVWKPVGERTTDGQSVRGWGTVEGCITSFVPSGEPDASPEQYKEHAI
ncbi:MAG: Zn-ribbon domain-containing OB-fold protein [Acidimicrobiales bacterium]